MVVVSSKRTTTKKYQNRWAVTVAALIMIIIVAVILQTDASVSLKFIAALLAELPRYMYIHILFLSYDSAIISDDQLMLSNNLNSITK